MGYITSVRKLVTFNPSMGFNVTTLGQKVTVYEGTVGLDVTRKQTAGVKSHIIDSDKKNDQDVVGLFCQIRGQRHTSYCFSVIFMLSWNHLAACR